MNEVPNGRKSSNYCPEVKLKVQPKPTKTIRDITADSEAECRNK